MHTDFSWTFLLAATFTFASLATTALALLLLCGNYANRLYRRARVAHFADKRVFITGTDTGFGRELALLLDRKGLVVYAGCFTEAGAAELREQASGSIRILKIDVTRKETLLSAKKFIEADLPPGEGLWGLVNNAGILRGLVFDFCSEDDYRKSMEVNFYGVMRTTEIFLPLIKRARGRIVNVSSMLGRVAVGCEPYTCSKYALEAYCNGLRRSLNMFGVHVATIEPGFHRTNLTSYSTWLEDIDRTWEQVPQSVKEEYGEDFKETVKRFFRILNSRSPLQSSEVIQVPRAVTHALSSERPKARYVCGLDANLMIRVFCLVPDWIIDICIGRFGPYRKVITLSSN